MERIHDMLGPDISVQRLLTVLLGEESAEYVWGLVAELGETGERAVMPLIEEIIRAREEILDYKDVILHLRRQLFGPKRARYVDPDQGELFPDQGAVIELRQAEELDPPERTRRKPKPRFLFTDECMKDLPTEVIEIDPAGDLSHLKKIGTQEHLALDYRRAGCGC